MHEPKNAVFHTVVNTPDPEDRTVSLRYFADLVSTFDDQLSYVEGLPKKDRKFVKQLAKRVRKRLRNQIKHGDIT